MVACKAHHRLLNHDQQALGITINRWQYVHLLPYAPHTYSIDLCASQAGAAKTPIRQSLTAANKAHIVTKILTAVVHIAIVENDVPSVATIRRRRPVITRLSIRK